MSLVVQDLVKHFGGVQAVKGVSFTVERGECVALIGPNGAGKSTTFACIAGQHALTSGQVAWAGQRVDALPPAQRLQRGIARTFQVAQTFEALTVLQNVQLLTQIPRGLQAYKLLDSAPSGGAKALLEQVGLSASADLQARDLPYGAKKRLELAIALAGLCSDAPTSLATASPAAGGAALPRLLLLDEPAAGLAATERAELMRLIKSLAQGQGQGIAVLYTEHNMDAVFGVADRVIVIIDGQIAAQGLPSAVANDPVVRRKYLGSSLDTACSTPEPPHA